MAGATHTAGATPHYYIPQPSRHPALVAVAMLLVIFGAAQWVNGAGWGKFLVFGGLALWAVIMFQWFSQAIGESEGKLYSDRVDVSFRWSMSWFIFSEVMFFAAFFGALYWARVFSVPMLGDLDHQVLWPDFKALWPSTGGGTASPAGTVEPFQVIG
ncbi:MAG: cytochrome c oxidase subunit 3, partial [Aquincola sp.]|nr:cytochrome c oxidase subunit 3 [Aquincola sp.]